MAIVDVVIPAYRLPSLQVQQKLMEMINRSQCRCGTHNAWECDRGKHSVMFQPTVESCIIHWSRNLLMAQSLYKESLLPNRPRADYIFMLDDDMLVEPGYLDRMLLHKKDVLTGIPTKRRDPPMPTIRQWDATGKKFVEIVEWNFDSQKIFEIDAAGTACMLVKRGVLEKLADAYLDCTFERIAAEELVAVTGCEKRDIMKFEEYFNRISQVRRKKFKDAIESQDIEQTSCWWFQFMPDPTGNERGEWAEDLTFCWKLKKLGFKIWADPQILPGHLGPYPYSVHDYRYWRESEKRNNPARPQEFDGTKPQLAEAAKV